MMPLFARYKRRARGRIGPWCMSIRSSGRARVSLSSYGSSIGALRILR